MEGQNQPGPLADLQRKLYSQNSAVRRASVGLKMRDIEAPTVWEPEPQPELEPETPPLSWAVKFLIGAVAFAVIAGGVSAVLLFGGLRSVSTDRILIKTIGPTNIASGDTVNLLITVTNKNPTTITSTSLVVDLPPGTRESTDIQKTYDHFIETVGDIAPGASVSRTVSAVFFGAENQVLTIPVRLEYKTEGSNALSVKKVEYTTTVTTSPISVTIASTPEVASGQSFTLSVAVRSNATTPLTNVALIGQYPFGFVPTSTNPKTQNSFWNIGTLAPGEEKKFSVTGTLTGATSDERVFTFTAGTAKDDGTSQLSIPYSSAVADLTISKPFLGTTLSLNQEISDTTTVSPGLPVSGILSWKNSLTVPVQNAQVTISFSGNAIDVNSIQTQNGFYRSSDSTLVFSSDTNEGLASLQPGDSGSAPFFFTSKSAEQLLGVRNPTITLLITVSGMRKGDGSIAQPVSSTITRKVLIDSEVLLTSSLVRDEVPFLNSGPIPPVPNSETQYAVKLQAKNNLNSLGGAKVTMVLPGYVRFTGKTSSQNGTITYDESSRTVTWLIGDISASATVSDFFQIAFLPSASQSGTSPRLVGGQTLTASDKFTKTSVSTTASALTTQITGQPSATGIVTK